MSSKDGTTGRQARPWAIRALARGAALTGLLITTMPTSAPAQESATPAAKPHAAKSEPRTQRSGLIGEIYAQSFADTVGPLGPDVFHVRYGRFSTMPASNARVHALMSRLLARNGLPANFASADVIACDSPSAMANPLHRRIMVCRGLLPAAETEDALAFVMAHELAHVLLQHRVEKRSTFGSDEKKARMALESVAIMGGLLAGGVPGVVIGAGIAAAEHGTLDTMQQGKLNSFDRQEEADADRVAVELTAQAGYNPSAGVDLVDRVGGLFETPARKAAPKIRVGTMRDGTPDLPTALLDGMTYATSQAVDLRRHPDADARIAALSQTIQTKYADASNRGMKKLGLDKEMQSYTRAQATPSAWKSDPSFADSAAVQALASHDGKTAINAIEQVPAANRMAGSFLLQAMGADMINDRPATLKYAQMYYRAIRPLDDKYRGTVMATAYFLRDTQTFAQVTEAYCNEQKQGRMNYKCTIRETFTDMEDYDRRHGLDRDGDMMRMIGFRN